MGKAKLETSRRILSEEEWKTLCCAHFKTDTLPENPPNIREATTWIAQLGGFMARKHDGHPGFITLWSGWMKLQSMTQLWRAIHCE